MTFYISPFYLSLLVGLVAWPFVTIFITWLEGREPEDALWGIGLVIVLLTLLFLNHYWI